MSFSGFWYYCLYSYSALAIKEYKEYRFPKDHIFCKGNTLGRGEVRLASRCHLNDFTRTADRARFFRQSFPGERIVTLLGFFWYRENNKPNNILFILVGNRPATPRWDICISQYWKSLYTCQGEQNQILTLKKTYYNHRLGTVNNINNNNREHYFEKHPYILKLRYGSPSPLHLIICLSDFVSLSIVCFYLILHVDVFATL